MAKIKSIALLVLGLIVSTGAFSNISTRDSVAAIYNAKLNVREATGKNDGPAVAAILKTVGLPEGNSWCGAFACACFTEAGVKTVCSAWAPSWFPQSKVIWKQGKGKTPRRADVFGLYFTNKRRVAHVGFVDRWAGGYAITVEGNTNAAGSREGDGVYKKRRLARQIHVVSDWIGNA